MKQRKAAEVLRQYPRPVVSTQVLGEFYVTVTRKFAKTDESGAGHCGSGSHPRMADRAS